MNADPDSQRRQPALRGDLQRDVVQVRVHLLHAHQDRDTACRDAANHVGPDAGERMIRTIAAPVCSHRHPIAVARIPKIEHRHHAVGHAVGRKRKKQRDHDREQPE